MKKLLITVLLMSACHQADYSADGTLAVCAPNCAAGQDCFNGYCVPAATTGDPNPIGNDGGSGPSSDSGGGTVSSDSGVPVRPEAGSGSADTGSSSGCTVLSLPGTGWVDLGSGGQNRYDITSQFTVAAWVWVQSGHPAVMTIWDLESYVADVPPGDNTGVRLSVTAGGQLLGFYGTSQGASTILSGDSLQLDRWNHVAFVRNGSDVELYINGSADDAPQRVNQTDMAVNWSESTADHGSYSLGRGRTTDPELTFASGFSGRIAAAGVWHRALLEPDVVALKTTSYPLSLKVRVPTTRSSTKEETTPSAMRCSAQGVSWMAIGRGLWIRIIRFARVEEQTRSN